jgi:D-alanine transaminase
MTQVRDNKMQIAVIHDKIIPLEELDSTYLDRGTFFGDGVYEVIRSYNGKIFALDEHLKRFARSLREISIVNIDIESVRSKILEAFAKAGIANAKIYFHVTRGSEMRNHLAGVDLEPNFFLTVTELGDSSSDADGVKVCTYPDIRWKRCDIKSLNLLPNVMAKMEAEKKGCQEAILVDDDGFITEGSASAFFMIDSAQKKLITRPLGKEILPSITRKIVEEIAPKVGLTIVEDRVTVDQACHADELFMAVTTKDVIGIVEFDGNLIGDGNVGPFTQKLKTAFGEYIASH